VWWDLKDGEVDSQDCTVNLEGGSSIKRSGAAGPWLLGVGGIVAVTALATLIVVRDNARGDQSLGALTPFAQVMDDVGFFLLQDPKLWISRIGGSVATFAVVAGLYLWWRRTGVTRDFAPVLVALGLAVIGQIFLLHWWVQVGVIFYAEAVMVVVAAYLMGRGRGQGSICDTAAGPPSYREALALLGIGIVAVFFRYYVLNRVLYYFEGELAPFMAGATTLEGMLLANIGWEGPWAPLGILYYLPIWAMTLVDGSTVLAVRLGSAVIGVLTLIVVYLVVRDVMGRTAALWAAALLAFDPLQVSWGRSDMHPHASTAWPGILLFGATVRALGTGATGWYVAVMLLMGLSWHQYPSGQFVVIVPAIAFAVRAWQNRGFLKASWRKAVLIVAGAGLWILGYPLASFLAVGEMQSVLVYVSRLGPRVLGGSDEGLFSGMPVRELLIRGTRNTWELILGLFTEVPRIFHQTVVPNLDGLAQRAMPWAVVACAVVGLALCCMRFREKWSAPLLAMVLAGVLPAILSDEAWLKRASLLYVVVIIIAAIPLSIVTDGIFRLLGRKARWTAGGFLVVAFLLWSSIWGRLWFSGQYLSYGVPSEIIIYEELDEHLEPDTLLIVSIWGDYIEGELVYLVRESFAERQPMALYITDPRLEEWPALLRQPLEALERLNPELWYWAWLGIGDQMPAVVKHRGWKRVVYLLEEFPSTESDLEILAERCPDLLTEAVFVGDDDEVIDGEVLPRYHVWIARCDDHRGLRTPRFSVPALP
jgi:hypothetical protein